MIDLNANESIGKLEQILTIDRPGRGETDHQKINICGGMTIFRRSSYLSIGGYNEDFIGWGGEDDYQAIKVKTLLKWYELPGRCYHLFHEREAPDMKWYQRNIQLLNKLRDMKPDEMTKLISVSANKIGMRNKYDTF